MSEHFIGNKILWPAANQDFQKEADCHVRFSVSVCLILLPGKCLNNKNFVAQNFLGNKEVVAENFLGNILKLIVVQKVLSNKLLLAEKVHGKSYSYSNVQVVDFYKVTIKLLYI